MFKQINFLTVLAVIAIVVFALGAGLNFGGMISQVKSLETQNSLLRDQNTVLRGGLACKPTPTPAADPMCGPAANPTPTPHISVHEHE